MKWKDRLLSIFYRVPMPRKLRQIVRTVLIIRGKESLFDIYNFTLMEKTDEKETKITELDWDNLIIIDACRYDLYQETVNENADYIISPASASDEFIFSHFSNQNFPDTVMVTANPYFLGDKFLSITGREPQDVFKNVFRTINTGWEDGIGSVHPEKVAKDAKNAEVMYPDSRKIIWFIQPHHPFIGSDVENDSLLDETLEGFPENRDVWDLCKDGDVSDDDVWEAYKQNLELVMNHVEELADELDGRTVLISDHGNLVGERGMYGHPPFVDTEALKKVPYEVLSER